MSHYLLHYSQCTCNVYIFDKKIIDKIRALLHFNILPQLEPQVKFFPLIARIMKYPFFRFTVSTVVYMDDRNEIADGAPCFF